MPTSQPDLARVRYLEQQMTQMSELIMKSFQINGGAPNSQAFEQLAMATEMLQQRSDRRGDTESEMSSMTETTMTSARSLGGGIPPDNADGAFSGGTTHDAIFQATQTQMQMSLGIGFN